ncbi:MAG: glucose 1-dehydrogenase [Halieaceae bacterium]|nr:glucose 1-dehydrogenase [Halieaceae bacterium]
MIDLQLEGQVAIVTGASRGLGASIALALAEQGVKVLAAARSVKWLHELEGSMPEYIKAVKCDLTDLNSSQNLPRQAVEIFGRLDILVNNAGLAPAGAFLEQDIEIWSNVMAVNVTAPMVLARAAGQYMTNQGSGKIINIASISGIRGKASLVAYSASKGALIQFTKALAAEWAKYDVQVNAIAPGAFETEAQKEVIESPDLLSRRISKIPARRIADAKEIGPLVCYLASQCSNFVSGSVYVIDGGESSKI